MARLSRFAVTAGFAISLALVASGARADDFCDALLRLRDAATTGFVSIQAESSGRDKWNSKLIVPTFASCHLEVINGSMTHLCVAGEELSLAEVQMAVRQTGERIGRCYGTPAEGVNYMDLANAGAMSTVFVPNSPFSIAAVSRISMNMRWNLALMSSIVQLDTNSPDASSSAEEEEEESTPAHFKLDPEYCQTLKKVISDAPNQFAAIRGKAVDSNSWAVTLRPAGAFSCSINTFGDSRSYYSCKLLDTTKEASARAAFDEVQQAIEACLGDSWLAGKKAKGNDVTLRYKNEDTVGSVELKLSRPYRTWLVKFDVNGW